MNKYAVVVKFVNAFAFAPHLENFSKASLSSGCSNILCSKKWAIPSLTLIGSVSPIGINSKSFEP